MTRFLAAIILLALAAPAHAAEAWLWWGSNATTTVPVSAANPLPVTATGGLTVMKTDGSNATAAALGAIVTGATGCNDVTKVVSGTGTCVTPGGGGSVADPSATIGLTAVNGSASSAIRSDGAPPLSQAIVPTWTGAHTFAQPITSTYVNASVLGAAIVNGGTGGTLGAGKTVTGTTGTGTKFQASVTVTDSVTAAVVNNAGDGSGTPGPVTITGVSGTGTPFQATGTIDGAGHLAGALTVTVAGSYTVDPTTTGEAVSSDAGLVGATVNLTLAGGAISSVDSISVAGAYTVPPTDPANEPVTGDSLTGAVLALGMNFAPSITGAVATAGLGFDAADFPFLTNASLNVTLSDNVGVVYGRHGAIIQGKGAGGSFLAISPITGVAAARGILEIDAVNATPTFQMARQGGVIGAPTGTLQGDHLAELDFDGYMPGVGFSSSAVAIIVQAAEDFTATSSGAELHISTAVINGGATFTDRLVIDGSGNTNILNGELIANDGDTISQTTKTGSPNDTLEGWMVTASTNTIFGLTVAPTGTGTGTAAIDMLSFHGAGGGRASFIDAGTAGGTPNTPLALIAGDNIREDNAVMWDGSSWANGGFVLWKKGANVASGSDRGVSYELQTTENAAAGPAQRYLIDSSGNTTVTVNSTLTIVGIPSAANCSGKPSNSIISTTGTGVLVQCP